MKKRIDCILIGFHDERMQDMIERVKPLHGSSSSYLHYLARSISHNGSRLKYSEAVNKSIEISTGYKCDLNIYRMPNMALHYIRQFLHKFDYTVKLVNNFNDGKEDIKALLCEYEPSCIGISTTCQVDPIPIREVVDFVKQYNNKCKIVIGGPYINSINFEYNTVQQDYILERMGGDFYIHERQGQKAFYEICQQLRMNEQYQDFSKVNNIIYRQGKNFLRTRKVPENIDLNEDPIKDFTFYENFPMPSVYVQTALSCQLKCAFCRYPILSGTPTYMSIESLEKNFDYLYSLGVNTLIFVDDSFNIPIDRFKAILKLMIQKKYNFSWYSFFRISHADDECYDLMEQSGCRGVILGVESGSNTILKNMDKQVTAEQLAIGIKKLNEHGIMSHASCMVGFPGETVDTFKKTVELLNQSKPTFYDIQIWYYENEVPIAKEKDYYKLVGYGYNWKHKDMDCHMAGKLVLEAIRSINGSHFMPSLSFNMWSLGYYLTQGATVKEFLSFSKYFSQLVGYEHEYEQNEEILDKLMHVFENNEALKDNLLSRQKS